MSAKRIRIFAGPNGSGKTTIVNKLRDEIPFGVYVNADDIETEIAGNDSLNLDKYQISLTTELVQLFFKERAFSPTRLGIEDIGSNLSVVENCILINQSLSRNSYIAADIAELIRQTLLENDLSFTYETVMSHPSKLEFIKMARENGYRVYLYYIATEDPEINISRVNIRIAQKGHGVSPEVIRSRYYKSLSNLKQVVKQTNRAYIFDNSGEFAVLIAEITNGQEVNMVEPELSPNWFIKYLVE